MSHVRVPTIGDIDAARTLIAKHLPPTPMWSYPGLDAMTGMRLSVKLENTQPVGAFKVRGGLNLIADLDTDQRARGVVAYSTGNHAQSIAYAARTFGAPCVIVMPEHPNPIKASAVRALGAELIEHGPTFDETSAHAADVAETRGMYLVSAANDSRILAGVATLYVEMFESAPDLDVVVVPVGSGTGAAAACLVTRAMAPACRVIGVQSEASPAAHDSWRAGHCVTRPNRSRVEGVATGSGFELTQEVMRESLADFVLVGDDDILAAQLMMLRAAHTLPEGAGALSLAGALALGQDLAGQRVGLVCTGGNASEDEIRRCLEAAADPDASRVSVRPQPSWSA